LRKGTTPKLPSPPQKGGTKCSKKKGREKKKQSQYPYLHRSRGGGGEKGGKIQRQKKKERSQREKKKGKRQERKGKKICLSLPEKKKIWEGEKEGEQVKKEKPFFSLSTRNPPEKGKKGAPFSPDSKEGKRCLQRGEENRPLPTYIRGGKK